MLEPIAAIAAPSCTFELLKGEWPKPVEHKAIQPNPVLAMIVTAPNYRMEARACDSTRPGFGRMGATFMLPPDREVIGRGTGGPVRVAHCVFDRTAYRTTLGRDADFSDAELARAFDVSSPMVKQLMRRLMQEASNPGFASEMLVESIATILLLECRREILNDLPAEPRGGGQGLTPRQLQLVDDLLERREIGLPSIEELATACGLRPAYFAKLFRKSAGRSVGAHVADWRLRRAEQLLTETNLPLKEIAFRLGFGSAAYFSTAFRRARRRSPSDYRDGVAEADAREH